MISGRPIRDVDVSVILQAEKRAKLRALRLAKDESNRIAAEVRRSRCEQQRP